MKVYIGIPMYGGACAEFVSSLLKTRMVFHHTGWEVEVDIHSNCSVLPKARNEIVKRFLDSEFDVLLFLDSDMAFSPVDTVKLVREGKEFAACAYRGKSEEVTYHCETGGAIRDWMDADSVATGFKAVRREVYLKMIEAYPSTRYEEKGETFHALYDFELHEGRYWGEDYNFCRKWKAIGGTIQVMTDATIKHIGSKAYEGNFRKHLEAQNESPKR